MEKLMNKIENQIDDLFDEFQNGEDYNNYQKIKLQLEKDCEINDIIKEIKRLQKIGTNNKDNSVEIEIKKLYKRLESYPIYQSYLIAKENLEEKLFMIKNTFEKYFSDLLKF